MMTNSENSGLTNGDVIRMDAARSNRFASVLTDVCDLNTSLATAAKNFAKVTCGPGEMQPQTVVLAFSNHMDKLLERLNAFVCYEEHIDDAREANHG